MTELWIRIAAQLAHPEWLGGVAAALGAAAAAVALARLRAARRLRTLLGAVAAPSAFPLASDLALLAAAACIGLALLGPRLGERTLGEPAGGVDLVLLMDVSRSMDARDVPPSRLDRARRTAAQVLERLAPGDRAALAAFAGRGVLLTPLTPDAGALVELLPAVDTELMGPGGSRLGAGVEAAIEAFEAGSERPRVLLVLGDGEDPEALSEFGVASALRARVRVVAVTFGSEVGATIPDHGVPLRDARGVAVVTRRGSERPSRLSSATGGALFEADAWGTVDPDRLVGALRRDAGAASGESVERRVAAVRVWPFAALAFLLLVVEARPALALRRARRVAHSAALRGAATLALAVLCLAPAGPTGVASADDDASLAAREEEVRAHPTDARALLRLGAARMQRGQADGAARAFLAAALYASEAELAATGYYALGVAGLERGDLEGARDAFFDALALAPGDRRARFNLEWTLVALERLPPPEAPARPEESAREGEENAGERRVPPPRPEASEATTPEAAPLPSLSEAERRRLLDQVRDDPSRAFREAARRAAEGKDARRRRDAPRW